MFCPFCHAEDTKVADSRLVADGTQVRRRRACPNCSERFTTFEYAVLEMPQIIKRDGRLVSFSEMKIRSGMVRAFEKSGDSVQLVDRATNQVIKAIRASGERSMSSASVGSVVLEVLKDIDPVAYIRFASVYKCFESISDFENLISELSRRGEK